MKRTAFVAFLILLVLQFIIAQQSSENVGFVFNVYSFLLGLISILLAVIAFLTRGAYVEMKNGIAALTASIVKIDNRLVRVETKLGIQDTDG